jgi:polar amino acid transport system substrate-binding protein
MKHYFLLAIMAASLLVQGPVMASQNEQPLEFGYIELRPFGYTDSDGKARGYLIELTKRVFARMNLSPDFQSHPAARLYRQLQSGETAFTLGAAKLHTLREAAVESEEPAIIFKLSIYTREDSPAISDLENLKGKRVLLMQGYSYGQVGKFFEKNADSMHIDYARNLDSALNMLMHGRADYLLNYQRATETLIAKKGIKTLKSEVIGETPVHFFVSRKLNNAQAIADAWDRELRALKRTDSSGAPPLNGG